MGSIPNTAQLEDKPMKTVKQLIYLLIAIILLVSILVLPASAAATNAAPTQSAVLINSTQTEFEAYCINGNNYFKLRDIAYALIGTDKQFEVTYDDLTKQVDLISNTAYTASGGEMLVSGLTENVAATTTPCVVYLNGTKLTLTAYLIGESNYIKLRDIAAAVNFGVTYVPENDTIEINTSIVYTPVPSTSTPGDLNVTLIGDSIGVGLTPYLKMHFPNLYSDSKVSRQFSDAKSIVPQLLQAGKLGPVVVIELGANGTIRESDMRKVIELIGSERKIVFVNVQLPRSWCAGNNATLSKVCLDYTNTIIADWYSASINKSSYFYSDGVHPNKAGATALAQIIADAINLIK